MRLLSKTWEDRWLDIISDKEVLNIAVTLFDGTKIGELTPITKNSLVEHNILKSLTAWRKEYGKYFFTEFEASETRTKEWLKGTVLKNPSQMLFLISSDEVLIGQYGFKNLSEKTVLMDNLIRGISGGHPKLIERSMMSLISWLFTNLDIENVSGSVLSDNPFAMIVNRAVGFEYTSDNKDVLPDGRYSREIILTREGWESKKKLWWEGVKD